MDTIPVVAAVIERNGRFLVCQRPLHKHHGGLWEFPGGKVEPGENLSQAAARELQEELGVVVTRVGACLLVDEKRDAGVVLNFLQVEIAGEPVALEHAALRWCTRAELLALPLAPGDLRFAQTLPG